MNLNNAQLKSKLNEAQKGKMVLIGCGDHLYVRKYIKTNKISYFFRKDNKSSLIYIGDYFEMTLREAREKIKKIINETDLSVWFKKQAGENEKKSKVPSFYQVAEEWLAYKKDLKRFSSIKSAVNNLEYFYKYPITELKNSLIKEGLVAKLKSGNVTAGMIRVYLQTLCQILDYAVLNDYIEYHNARLMIKSPVLPKQTKSEGMPYVPFDGLADVLKAMVKLKFAFSSCLLMQIFTCLRPGENCQLRLSYFDLERKMIVVPGEIMKIKDKQVFRIPLTREMEKLYLYVLKQRREILNQNEYLFTYNYSNFYQHSKLRRNYVSNVFAQTCGLKIVPHGFRKTARSYFADHGVPVEVAAKCLDHTLQTGADNLYQKSDLFDLRVPVMAQWTAAVYELLPPEMKEWFN